MPHINLSLLKRYLIRLVDRAKDIINISDTSLDNNHPSVLLGTQKFFTINGIGSGCFHLL